MRVYTTSERESARHHNILCAELVVGYEPCCSFSQLRQRGGFGSSVLPKQSLAVLRGIERKRIR